MMQFTIIIPAARRNSCWFFLFAVACLFSSLSSEQRNLPDVYGYDKYTLSSLCLQYVFVRKPVGDLSRSLPDRTAAACGRRTLGSWTIP